MPAIRIVTFAVPSFRRVRVGAALMLERPAAPGLAGAARDFLRLLLGKLDARWAWVRACGCCSAGGLGHLARRQRWPHPRRAATPSSRAGTRLLGLAIIPIIVTQAPFSTLVTQIVLLALTANSRGYCGTQLLADPLTRGRVQMLASMLESVSLPLWLTVPVSTNTDITFSILHGELCSGQSRTPAAAGCLTA